MAHNAIPIFALAVALGFASCAALARGETAEAPAPPPAMAYVQEATPLYRFYPGDEIEITVYSAPELSRTVTVAPDGRVSLPLIPSVMAAEMTEDQLRDALVAAYAPQLRMPDIDVSARAFGSRQVFVGGEVAQPGIYEMPAQIDAFQAVALAGGFLPSARRGDVLVMSRAGGGEASVREVDLSPRAMRTGLPDAHPLARYDVVYVPRSRISQLNLFMQQYVRDALPVQFGLYYDISGNRN